MVHDDYYSQIQDSVPEKNDITPKPIKKILVKKKQASISVKPMLKKVVSDTKKQQGSE